MKEINEIEFVEIKRVGREGVEMVERERGCCGKAGGHKSFR